MNKNSTAQPLLSAVAYSDTTPIVSAGKLVDEFDTVALQLVNTGSGHGDWKVEGSNDFVPAAATGFGGVAGTWFNVTSLFAPTIATVTAAGTQGSQAPFDFKAYRVTFTPSSGSGTVSALGFAKSQS